jgi:arylsulfatase A-like enzyme
VPPNILLILADDLGWRDLGCYGSSFYETPNIDSLSHEGTRFTDAYASAPVCSPTRASIQTGQYPARVGVTNFIPGEARGALLEPAFEHRLPDTIETLAERLAARGYRRWHVGKWHLGGNAENSLPTDHGFEENIAGSHWGMPENGFFSPYGMPELSDGPAGEYLTDRLTDEAIGLIESRDPEDPFLLQMNYYSVHVPVQAKAETVEKYERKRTALGLDDATEFEVGEAFPADHKKEERVTRRVVQSDPEYAAMVQHLDENVGRLLDALEREGIADETIVVFTSDNGGLATAEGSPTCNRPLSEGKGWMREGGNRVPLIVRWPDVAGADRVSEEPATSPDIYPTLLEAATCEPTDDQICDGVSLRPIFEGGDLEREAVFWHYPHYGNQGGTPTGAVRAGDWKLIEFFEDEHVELYDLSADVREVSDCSERQPDVTADLLERLRNWRDDVDAAMPEPNPEFEPWDDRLEVDPEFRL